MAALFDAFSSVIAQGTRSMTPHATAVFSTTRSTVRTLLTVFGERRLQPLHVLRRHLLEALLAERGDQVPAKDRILRGNPARLQLVAFAYPSRKRERRRIPCGHHRLLVLRPDRDSRRQVGDGVHGRISEIRTSPVEHVK